MRTAYGVFKNLASTRKKRLSQARSTYDSITVIIDVLVTQTKLILKAIKERIDKSTVLANGKSKIQSICACMRKLLCIACAVLTFKLPFTSNDCLAA
jgi:hypothetical protein